MNLIAKIIKALHESRRRQAEAVIRRYSHLVEEAHDHERKRQDAAEIPASPSLIRKTLPACTTACIAVAAAALINSSSTAGEAGFPTACALREIPVITAIEAHGDAQDISSDRLAYATFKMLTARRACYEGHVDGALRLYDEILNIELAKTDK